MRLTWRTLRNRSLLFCLLGLIAVVSSEVSGLIREANAIPAFARKYAFDCSVCHVPSFPKLNDFGNLFRDHGYQIDTEADLPILPGLAQGYWPVSLHTTVGYQTASLRVDGSGITTGTFGFTGLDIQAMGLLAHDLAFNVMLTPGLSSGAFGQGTTGDLDSAWVRFNNLQRFLGIREHEYLMNLKVGKYELDVPFSEARSPTLNTPFVMYHYQAGTPWTTVLSGLATTSYKNPNDFAIGENQLGAELSGIASTPAEGYFRYALSAMSNSNLNAGSGGVGGGRGTNFYGHLTQSFGGYGIVTGHRVGIFGVYGDSPTQVNATCPSCVGVAGSGQPFSRVGVDVSMTYDKQWNLYGAVMHANDSKNLFVSQGFANPQNASWNGAFVELDWYPTQLPIVESSGWLFSYRYDLIHNERQGDASFAKSFNDVDSHTGLIRYNFLYSTLAGAALHAEYNTFRAKGVGGGGGDQVGQTFLIGIDFAI
jgi:hypothetical protein